MLDIPALSELAHTHHLPLLIDATFVTPYLCQPIELGGRFGGAFGNVKFLGGHGVDLWGVVVDGGTFDWQSSDKFPTLGELYVS